MNEFLAILSESQPFDNLLHNLEKAIDSYNLNQTAENKQLLEYHVLVLFQKIIIEKSGGLEEFLKKVTEARQVNKIMNHFNQQS